LGGKRTGISNGRSGLGRYPIYGSASSHLRTPVTQAQREKTLRGVQEEVQAIIDRYANRAAEPLHSKDLEYVIRQDLETILIGYQRQHIVDEWQIQFIPVAMPVNTWSREKRVALKLMGLPTTPMNFACHVEVRFPYEHAHWHTFFVCPKYVKPIWPL
jgi:hypothetical protein